MTPPPNRRYLIAPRDPPIAGPGPEGEGRGGKTPTWCPPPASSSSPLCSSLPPPATGSAGWGGLSPTAWEKGVGGLSPPPGTTFRGGPTNWGANGAGNPQPLLSPPPPKFSDFTPPKQVPAIPQHRLCPGSSAGMGRRGGQQRQKKIQKKKKNTKNPKTPPDLARAVPPPPQIPPWAIALCTGERLRSDAGGWGGSAPIAPSPRPRVAFS